MLPVPKRSELARHRQALSRSQAALAHSLEELENVTRQELDLGHKLAEYSPALVLLGFGLGLWLGSRPAR